MRGTRRYSSECLNLQEKAGRYTPTGTSTILPVGLFEQVGMSSAHSKLVSLRNNQQDLVNHEVENVPF